VERIGDAADFEELRRAGALGGGAINRSGVFGIGGLAAKHSHLLRRNDLWLTRRPCHDMLGPLFLLNSRIRPCVAPSRSSSPAPPVVPSCWEDARISSISAASRRRPVRSTNLRLGRKAATTWSG